MCGGCLIGRYTWIKICLFVIGLEQHIYFSVANFVPDGNTCTLHIILLTYVSAFPGRGRHFTRWTRLWSSHRCDTGIRSRSFVYLPCSACCWFQISRWNKDYLVCEVGGALFWQKRWQYLRKGKEMITELTLLISGVHLEYAIFSLYIYCLMITMNCMAFCILRSH